MSRYIALRLIGGDRSNKISPILDADGHMCIYPSKHHTGIDTGTDTIMTMDLETYEIMLTDIPANKRKNKLSKINKVA